MLPTPQPPGAVLGRHSHHSRRCTSSDFKKPKFLMHAGSKGGCEQLSPASERSYIESRTVGPGCIRQFAGWHQSSCAGPAKLRGLCCCFFLLAGGELCPVCCDVQSLILGLDCLRSCLQHLCITVSARWLSSLYANAGGTEENHDTVWQTFMPSSFSHMLLT